MHPKSSKIVIKDSAKIIFFCGSTNARFSINNKTKNNPKNKIIIRLIDVDMVNNFLINKSSLLFFKRTTNRIKKNRLDIITVAISIFGHEK
ncbi:MAG: hypothetical protein IKJ59_02345 [Clostridia bacterium]|nr:hypothetical protein [Clostridia bacterium]